MRVIPPPLRLPQSLRDAICAQWRVGRATDREPCGFLLGADPERARGVLAVANTHPEPKRGFYIEARAHLDARRTARALDQSVIGVWHGHVVGPARPSRADCEGAPAGAADLMLIAGCEGPQPPRLTAWRRVDAEWLRCRIELE